MRIAATMRLLALACLAGAAGCAEYTVPIVPDRPMSLEERNFESVWRASQDVLRKYYFQPDRQDRRTGTITTEPLLARQAFEFWRKDAASRQDLMEGTLQTIYRIARVQVRPTGPEARTYAPVVEVTVYRTDRRPSEARMTLEFSQEYDRDRDRYRRKAREPQYTDEERQEMEAVRVVRPEQTEAAEPVRQGIPPWLTPLGRDEKLEAKLQAEILSRQQVLLRG